MHNGEGIGKREGSQDISGIAAGGGRERERRNGASTYRLDAEGRMLGPHVGQRVEITGRLRATSGPDPLIAVVSLRTIASSC